MTTNEFLQTFKEFLGRCGWPTDLSPWAIVEQWESLVNQAAEGYQWGLYEFTNDLAVRDLLEEVFRDEKLARFGQIGIMRQHVEAADAQLKGMFLLDAEIGGADASWWHRGVLATADDEYVDDMKRLHGIEIRR
jgi:hypothetical protein